MFKGVQWFVVAVALAFLILGGCSQETGNVSESENQTLRARIAELERIVDEQNVEIEEYKRVYELRNILDIQARQILSALNSGVFSENETSLLDKNVVIKKDRLLFSFGGYNNEIIFFQNQLDFERLRQRFYFLDEEGRFITGYEIFYLSEDIQECIDSRAVFVFTFVEEPSGWELADIGIDR